MKKNFFVILLLVTTFSNTYSQQIIPVRYVPFFDNTNHPQVAYWFFPKEMLRPEAYKGKIDSLARFSKYTLIFLTSRNGVNFYDEKVMHPVFEDLVSYAHKRGLKIGLQLWESKAPVAIENTERLIQEAEVVLDESGSASLNITAKHARDKRALIKSELLKVYAFKKTGDGFYDPNTLKDITANCSTPAGKENIDVNINAGKELKGYNAYILTQHYYNFSSNHSADAEKRLADGLKAYADIPFDAVGLDEYSNLRVATTWELQKANETFRERSYSLAMAKEFKENTGMSLDKTLFDMRFAPVGKPEVRIKAINAYMSAMREGTMHEEKVIYQKGKEYFGKNTFIGLHDTHHNFLDGDEIWQTGLNWWNVKRDYGHSDEGTPTPTQLGIGMSYPMNVMYNMYYNKSLENITQKAFNDLRYGIRTHYHAINDVQGWGVSVEKPAALEQINKVENAARLLNQFNPSFPQVKLLVVFGMEALSNWYPDTSNRGLSDINNKLAIEEKAKQLWNAGYINALVPTDLINDGRLTLNGNGKPVLQGHTFDAVVFLYAQYAKESTFKFLENYVSKGGKLMVEGNAMYDYVGNNVEERWKKIADKAIAKSFSVNDIDKLGVAKNNIKDGVLNEDGSYSFTNYGALSGTSVATFSFQQNGVTYAGEYKGMAAIKINEKGKLERLAATGFRTLTQNGTVIFSLDKPVDVFVTNKNGRQEITIADETNSVKVLVNKL